MAFMRLFLQDSDGGYSRSHALLLDSLPRVGTIVQAPGRPSILVQAVCPALPPREDDERGRPAHIYALAMNVSMASALTPEQEASPELAAA